MVLLWLLPPVVVTLAAMAWVGWWGREERGRVDRDEALRRMGKVLAPTPRWWRRTRRQPGYAIARRAPEHSSGVAVRRSAAVPPATAPVAPVERPEAPAEERRAS